MKSSLQKMLQAALFSWKRASLWKKEHRTKFLQIRKKTGRENSSASTCRQNTAIDKKQNAAIDKKTKHSNRMNKQHEPTTN